MAQARYVPVSRGHRGGMSVISAALGTPGATARDQSRLALLDVLSQGQPVVSALTLAGRFVGRPLRLLVILSLGSGGLLRRGMRRRRMDRQGGEVNAA